MAFFGSVVKSVFIDFGADINCDLSCRNVGFSLRYLLLLMGLMSSDIFTPKVLTVMLYA